MNRRNMMIGGGVLALGAVGFVAVDGQNLFYAALAGETLAQRLTVEQAHAQAIAKDITLIDIRRPDEWAQTGSGQGAQRLDMLRADFIPALTALMGGDTSAPVALICARGVRSAHVANRLAEAGFTQIIDVPEGMLGSRVGSGWLRKGLPVVR